MEFDRKRTYQIVFVFLIIFILLSSFFVYSHYLDLKKTLIEKISERITLVLGQRVEIGNLSFSPAGGINLSDISIKNPKNFASGELLRVKRLHLDLQFLSLLKGRFYFKNIVVFVPVLTLIKDKAGRMNISAALMNFLSEKSTIGYRVENLRIESGGFDFNRDGKYRVTSVNLLLKNLSSHPNTKSMIESNLLYAPNNRIYIHGWVYLQDRPLKANLSVSSRNFSLAAFRNFFESYRINAERTKLNIVLRAEGNTEDGFRLKTDLKIEKGSLSFLSRETKDIRFHTDAFLNLRKNFVTIHNLSLDVDNIQSVMLRGSIGDLKENPSYQAEIWFAKLDLSYFPFLEDLRLKGIVTSDDIKVSGKMAKKIPEISGKLLLRGGGIRTQNTILENINANLLFSPAQGVSLTVNTTGKILRAGGNSFNKPPDIKIAANVQGIPHGLQLKSSTTLSPFEIKTKEGKEIYVKRSNFRIDGIFNGTIFSGKNSVQAEGISYAGFALPDFQGSSTISFQRDEFTLKNLHINTKNLASLISHIKVSLGDNKSQYKIEIKNMNISSPERKIELNQGNLYLNLHREKEAFTGDSIFSIAKIVFGGVSSSAVSGILKFDEKYFSLNIAQAKIFEGRIKLDVQGKTLLENPFPVRVYAIAEDVDLGGIGKTVLDLTKIPYSISGIIKRGDFKGMIDSKTSIWGNASAEAIKISAVKKESGRNLLREVSLLTEISFKGKDFIFETAADLGKVAIRTSGTVKNFLEKEKHAHAKITLTETKAADIRTSLWDIFPDSLLYVGLNGSLSSEFVIDYGENKLDANGELTWKDFMLEGEFGEYSVGPVNGTIPIVYSKTSTDQQTVRMPSFDKSSFEDLIRYYSQGIEEEGFQELTVASFHYGFRLLENIRILAKQEGSYLNIGYFNANIFGGRFFGSALIEAAEEFKFKAGLLLKDFSLTTLCEEIESIKGYLSGKVDGVATLKGSLLETSQLMGKADLWTYGTPQEKTKISKEFLQKIGGPSLKTYLGDRRYDKGTMSLYLQNGYLIFKELEISNRNIFGITDLSIKAAPLSNRIAIDHLLWTMVEAGERTKKK